MPWHLSAGTGSGQRGKGAQATVRLSGLLCGARRSYVCSDAGTLTDAGIVLVGARLLRLLVELNTLATSVLSSLAACAAAAAPSRPRSAAGGQVSIEGKAKQVFKAQAKRERGPIGDAERRKQLGLLRDENWAVRIKKGRTATRTVATGLG